MAQADIVPSSGASEDISSPPNSSATPSVIVFTGGEEIMCLGSEYLYSHGPN